MNRPFNKSKSQGVSQRVEDLKESEACNCSDAIPKIYCRIDDLEKDIIYPLLQAAIELKTNYQIMKQELIRLYRMSICFAIFELWFFIVIGVAIYKLMNK